MDVNDPTYNAAIHKDQKHQVDTTAVQNMPQQTLPFLDTQPSGAPFYQLQTPPNPPPANTAKYVLYDAVGNRKIHQVIQEVDWTAKFRSYLVLDYPNPSDPLKEVTYPLAYVDWEVRIKGTGFDGNPITANNAGSTLTYQPYVVAHTYKDGYKLTPGIANSAYPLNPPD